MGDFMINNQFGLKLSAISLAVFLASCGGGGGDGYYGDEKDNSNNSGGNDSTTDTKNIVESLGFSLQDAEAKNIEIAQDNSKILIPVQALNSDKGGVAGKKINLSISDTDKLGVSSKTSQVTTGDDGFAVFEVNVPTITATSGKVQLTATVDGTTIKQVFTLNIQKASVIQSEYKLKIDQGVVLNLPKGKAEISALITDKNGGIKADQSVTVTLPAEMQDKFSVVPGATIKTDATGYAKFSIVANPDLTFTEITALVNKSINLDFRLVDEFKAESQAQASITFKDISKIVQKLEIVTADESLVAQAGETIVKVIAKNSEGDLLTNKKVRLAFTDKSTAYGVSIVQSEVMTDAKGYAVFIIKSASSYPIALSQQGVNLKATYVDSTDISATSTIKVITADTSASNQEAIQRLEIASSYKINAQNDSIEVTVKGVNNKGEAATKGSVILALNAEAVSNGVTFDGSAEQAFKSGYAKFTLKTNAKTSAAIEALVQAGITATFTADNGINNSIKITVESEEKSEEALQYLAIDPINSSFDYTKNQTINVVVKAIGVTGSALKGEKVNLAFAARYTTTQLQALGLTLTGSSSKVTNDEGNATFTYQYRASGSAAQKILVENGINLIASPASGIGVPSNTILNFKAPTAQGEVDLDYLNVDMLGSLVLKTGAETTIAVKVNAVDTQGKTFANQRVSIGLNNAALSNGVSLATASALTTDANGQATFSVKVKANNTSELANLVANGITVAIQGVRQDGTAYTVTRKVEVSEPVVVIPNLAALNLTYDVQTVSVLGGEVKVKVVAKDSLGQIIANTPVAIALSGLAGSRVSLSDSALATNSKGEAEFTVNVSEGSYDASLIKNGITFAVVGTNLNNGDRIQQTGTIQVAIPKDSVNLRLTAEQKALEFGKSYQLQIAVKDELGANTGYPVNLTLNKVATDAGIRLSSDSVLTAANGSVAINLILPKEMTTSAKQALIDLGDQAIQVKGSIKNPKGEVLESTIQFSVFEAVNPNHLTIATSKASLSVDGDKSIITVQLLDVNGLPVQNEQVNLAANNAATLIVGTPGSGHETNTSDPQTVKTDSNGNAFFALEIDGETVDEELLIASGIELTATNTNTNGAQTTQIYRLSAFKPTPPPPGQPLPAQYNLRIEANKSSLNVRNDVTDVTVTLVDSSGGGVADKYVELAIDDFVRNGAIIVGASGLTTNENGQAVFKVKIDENVRNASYTAAEFDIDNLNLNAKYSETGFIDATQVNRVNVVQSAVQNPIASIVIGVNPTETGTSTDGVYYTRNLSVSVVDFDGKPLANQKIDMDITPQSYLKGRYIWALAPIAGESPVNKWIGPAESYYDLSNPRMYLDTNSSPNRVMDNQGTPNDFSDDVLATPVLNPIIGCLANLAGNAISNNEVTNIPVKVPTFLGQGATATYTTDAEGKFDFVIRYPKIYAQWLNVQVGASSKVATLPTRTTYNLGLPSVTSDYSTDGTYGPNLRSPYGVLTTSCP